MEKHPDDCCCEDCMPEFPDVHDEAEQQHQIDLAEQFEALIPIPLPAEESELTEK